MPTRLTTVTVATRPSSTSASGAGAASASSSVPPQRSRSITSPETKIAMTSRAMTPGATTAYGARSVRPACTAIDRKIRVNSGAVTTATRSPGERRKVASCSREAAARTFIPASPAADDVQVDLLQRRPAGGHVVAQVPDQAAELAGRHRVHPGGRFVQDEDLRVADQPSGQVQPLLHAARPGLHPLVRPVGQAHPGQQPGRPGPAPAGVAPGTAPPSSAGSAGPSGGCRVLARRRRPDRSAAGPTGHAGPRRAQGCGPARGRQQHRREDLTQRGLTGTVGAEQAVHLAGGDLQIEAVQRHPLGVTSARRREGAGQRAGGDCGGRGPAGARLGRSRPRASRIYLWLCGRSSPRPNVPVPRRCGLDGGSPLSGRFSSAGYVERARHTEQS